MPTHREYQQYIKDLSQEEAEWVRKFYNEYYHGATNSEILTTDEMKKEANRNHNILNRDPLGEWNNSEIVEHVDWANKEEFDTFMRDAADEWDYMNVYKQQGYKNAIQEIFYQTERDLKNSKIETFTTLSRFLVKYMNLKRFHEKRNK